MPAFPKPSATETDPVAGPNLTTHAALTTTAHGGIVASDDSRLSDARTPTAHKLTHATGGSDVLTPPDIGAATTGAVQAAQADATSALDLVATKAAGTKAWATATAYIQGQMVTNGGHTYTANDAHTSGATFAGDLGSHWTLLPLTASDVGAIASTALDTDTALSANSDTRVPSQKAIKAYADQIIASADAMVMKGVIDCSTNPNYPAADRGWTYRVSVAGKIGGASGTNVEAGDLLLCLTDGTSAGNQATVGSAWSIAQTNLDGAVIGPTSSVDARIATFSGTSGKVIQDGGLLIADMIAKGIIDAKGDLIVGTADNAYARKAVGANTRVLAADSTQSDGLAWVDAQPVIPTPVAGGYYPWTFANGAQANAEGIIMFCPVILPPGTIDRIMMSVVTTPGSAGSVHRLGLYTQRAGSRFGTMDLLVDAGTVATTSTGDKEATVSVTLTVPTLAFIACVQQGAPTTRAAVRSSGTNVYSQIGSGATGPFHNALGGMKHVGAAVSGALPSTAVGTVEFNQPHWGVVRYA